jgi:protocatechuate 3,4-dioxygenase alpha subunit
MSFKETPAQTVGPFFAVMLDWHDGPSAAPADAPGCCWLGGTVYDGAGEPVPDALIEVWQPPPIEGFARCLGDASGRWRLWIRRPEGTGDGQAPHVALSVFARGLIDRVVTRVYFPEDAEAHAHDPVLSSLDDRARTLVAVASEGGYRFDIHLQGPHETVFIQV